MTLKTVLARTAAAVVLSAAIVGLSPAAPAAAAPTRDYYCYFVPSVDNVRCYTSKARAAEHVDITRYVIGARFFAWANMNADGPIMELWVPRACTAAYDDEGRAFRIWVMPFEWERSITSVRTFNYCDVKLFDNLYNVGNASPWIDSSSHLGNVGDGWNDRARSLRLS